VTAAIGIAVATGGLLSAGERLMRSRIPA